ncbi:MAG: hypothetical protein ACTSX2_03080 [Candidatus Thorarchaeota archaeon]
MKKFLVSILMILALCIPATTSAEFFSDIIVTSPDGIWTDERAYSSLEDAISAVGSSNRTIVVASEEVVTDLTIPSNVSLDFKRGGKITYSGQLTINTTNISAPDQPIFNPTGSGEADFARGTELRSAWFNNLNEMFDQTVDNYVTVIINSGWAASVTADATVGDNVTLKWEGPGQRIVVNSGFTLSNVKNISAGSHRIFGGSGDIDFKTGSVLRTSWFDSFRSAVSYVDDEDVDLTLVIDGVCTIDTNTTIDEYINLQFENGALLSPAAGVTLTIHSPESLIIGRSQQAFAGSGVISFSSGGTVYPEWWGLTSSSPDGLAYLQDAAASITSGTLILPSYTVELSDLWTISAKYINLVFQPGTILHSTSNNGLLKIEDSSNCRIENPSLSYEGTGVALHLDDVTHYLIQGGHIAPTSGTGVQISGNSASNTAIKTNIEGMKDGAVGWKLTARGGNNWLIDCRGTAASSGVTATLYGVWNEASGTVILGGEYGGSEDYVIGIYLKRDAAKIYGRRNYIDGVWLEGTEKGIYIKEGSYGNVIKHLISISNKNGHVVMEDTSSSATIVDWLGLSSPSGGGKEFIIGTGCSALIRGSCAFSLVSDSSTASYIEETGLIDCSSPRPGKLLDGTMAYKIHSITGGGQISVKGKTLLKTNNTAPHTITFFKEATEGQIVYVLFGDDFTNVDFTGTNMYGNGGADWYPDEGDSMIGVYDGTYWYFDVSDNTP